MLRSTRNDEEPIQGTIQYVESQQVLDELADAPLANRPLQPVVHILVEDDGDSLLHLGRALQRARDALFVMRNA